MSKNRGKCGHDLRQFFQNFSTIFNDNFVIHLEFNVVKLGKMFQKMNKNRENCGRDLRQFFRIFQLFLTIIS